MREIEIKPPSTPRFEGVNFLRAPSYLKIKRSVDFSLACLFLIAASPLMTLIALAIKLYSPGPVFYRQKRVGKNGKVFDMIKFRSMRVGNHSQVHKEHVQRLIRENASPSELGGRSLKLEGDPRITRPGKTLRKLSLDELPQFFNVLKGEMSIVGPRPSIPYEYELYDEWHKKRLAVLPGITGLWQVTAHNQVPFNEMVQIDLDYINHMSLWQDLKIMIRTPFEMLKGKGGG